MIGSATASWLLTAVFAAAAVPSLRPRQTPGAPRPGSSIPWLVRAGGRGPGRPDPAAAGQAAMSVGMAAMLIALS
jgi:hypothetical protein